MKRRVIYPGTFDPVTYGHLDVIERALKLYDEIIIGITNNQKKTPLFSLEERADLLRKSIGKNKRVKIMTFECLLVDFAKREKCGVIIKGLRELSDFTQEFTQAIVNRKLYPEMETVLIITDPKYFYLNSSGVKEVASLGGDIRHFVPRHVEEALKRKINAK